MPPAPTVPPPPAGGPLPPVDPESRPTDNPIAVAGLVISLLSLILAIIVLGGLIAIAGIILSYIGLKRSKMLGRGRGLAITGIVLSLLSIVVSGIALAILIAALTGGEDVVRNGIVTSSDNDEFPPQDDLVDLECTASDSGGVPLAIITIENKSPGRSVYGVTVEWETATDPIVAEVSSEFVDAGETEVLRLFERSSRGIAEQCRVTRIDRSGLFFFN